MVSILEPAAVVSFGQGLHLLDTSVWAMFRNRDIFKTYCRKVFKILKRECIISIDDTVLDVGNKGRRKCR